MGTVQKSSDHPLIRLFINLPPAKPVDRSSDETNVFLVVQTRMAYEKEWKRYLDRLLRHRNATRLKIDESRWRLDSFLVIPDTFRLSDVVTTARRINDFLSEPTMPSRKFVLFCIDGQHNKDKSQIKGFQNDITVLIVTGGLGEYWKR